MICAVWQKEERQCKHPATSVSTTTCGPLTEKEGIAGQSDVVRQGSGGGGVHRDVPRENALQEIHRRGNSREMPMEIDAN